MNQETKNLYMNLVSGMTGAGVMIFLGVLFKAGEISNEASHSPSNERTNVEDIWVGDVVTIKSVIGSTANVVEISDNGDLVKLEYFDGNGCPIQRWYSLHCIQPYDAGATTKEIRSPLIPLDHVPQPKDMSPKEGDIVYHKLHHSTPMIFVATVAQKYNSDEPKMVKCAFVDPNGITTYKELYYNEIEKLDEFNASMLRLSLQN